MEDDWLLNEKDVVSNRWMEYFKRLLHTEVDEESEIVSVGR